MLYNTDEKEQIFQKKKSWRGQNIFWNIIQFIKKSKVDMYMTYLVTPTILPGINLINCSLVAKNPACGPPYPRGIPNLWLEPTAMSMSNSPGGRNIVKARRSVAHTTNVWNKVKILDDFYNNIKSIKCRYGNVYKFLVIWKQNNLSISLENVADLIIIE